MPIGIAVARKRPQEASSAVLNSGTSLPLQQPINKDMNCFGIRVADLGKFISLAIYQYRVVKAKS